MNASPSLMIAERLTLGVLMSGVLALALSDFVSPIYWSLPTIAAILRWWYGSRFSLSEMQASIIGWIGFLWVGLELAMGRPWVVAFTDFLLILAFAVTIEAATPRNHLHRMLTGLFLTLAGAVLTDSVLYILPLAALMWFAWRSAACLYGINQPLGDLPIISPKRDMRIMALMAVLTLLMFITLPRFDVQSKLQATQPRMETTGFSNQVQLGDFARELDATVVLRIESPQSNTDDFRRRIIGRYWRGAVLSEYVNHGWQQQATSGKQTWQPHTIATFTQKPNALNIDVFREASDHPYILLPVGIISIQDIASRIQLDKLGQLTFVTAPSHRLRLNMSLDSMATSQAIFYPALRPPIASEIDKHAIPQALQNWVSSIRTDEQTSEQTLEKLNQTLRGWTYDLQAPIDAKQPIVSFLKNQRGHCELYATTLALAARTLGLPSRIVNGYFGGEWNQAGEFLIVRQQHAHSWVEVWMNGQWQHFDPTPNSRWQLTGVRFPAWDELWETVKLNWYRYVLSFQNDDREALVKQLINWLKTSLIWLVAGTSSVLAIMILMRSRKSWRWRILIQRNTQTDLDQWLKKHGFIRPAFLPLRLIDNPKGISNDAWKAWIQAWEKQAYGNTPKWTRRELKKHLRALSNVHW